MSTLVLRCEMKAKWKDEEIKMLFETVELNNKRNIPLLNSFKEFGTKTHRNALSVRNFYYDYVKILNNNEDLQRKLGIDIKNHTVQEFVHFNKKTAQNLVESIENLTKAGMSTRGACLELSNGNAKEMLRLQNKYRSEMAKKTKILKFPATKLDTGHNTKLSDEDIKSLFLGLVKLVNENAKTESKEKMEKFLEQTEEEKRKHIIELEQKQFEIERLNQSISELKAKNISLNKSLENYRIDFLKQKNQNNQTPINSN